jgi:stress response protein SCP2
MHTGDDMTGTGDTFDEEILVNLRAIDATIHHVFFVVVSIHHGFDEIKGGFWSIISTKGEQKLFSTHLKGQSRDHLHVMARLSRGDGVNWSLENIAAYVPFDKDEKVPIQERIDRALSSLYLTGRNS